MALNHSIIFLLYALLHSIVTFSQQEKKVKRFRVSPLPVIYYSPETRFGFGGLLAANFHTAKDSVTTGSYLQSSLLYTVNSQYAWGNSGRIYSPQNKHIFQYRFYLAFFPEFFYGYQTEEPKNYKDPIEYNRLWFEFRKYWRVRNHLYLGFYGRFNRIFNVQSEEDGSLEMTKPPGYNGYYVAGFSPALNYDSRNSQVYPLQGYYLELLWTAHPGFMSEHTFGNFKLDARTYRPLKRIKEGVIAFQLLLNLNQGDVPFKDMAEIGGADLMRGYYRGYYRYKNYYAFQMEFRMMVSDRFGFAAWVGGALNSDQWYEPFQHPLRPNGGIGLRVRINKLDKLNIRGDFGVGHEQNGFYLDVAEAF
ncbi:MAG TPA: hypothetical protein VFW11_05550 [Cyclobacteriaceae bacterium]|nr:hypothetical protein [Cyclobacteriaceae bacterium]